MAVTAKKTSGDAKQPKAEPAKNDLMIEAAGLIKVYKVEKVEVQALRGLNMKIRKGEIVTIMGPSGSGKTTLLNIIGGLDVPTAGYLRVGGISVGELSYSGLVQFRRKTVGHVFQNLNLISSLTAAENVELPMVFAGVSKGERAKRTGDLLAQVGLSNRASHKPEELSGGEQQRVAIAAALANNSPVILADEPTGELDSATAKKVVDLIIEVSRAFDKTTIIVTHDPAIARPCDRIMRIEDGVIKASYTTVDFAEGAPLATSYIDRLRERIEDLDKQIKELDENIKHGKMDPDEFVEQRSALKQSRKGLEDELRRLGG